MKEFDYKATYDELSEKDPLAKEFALELIKISDAWHAGKVPDTPKEVLNEMQENFAETCKKAGASEETCKGYWEKVEGTLKNPALALFTKVPRGDESEFFFPFLTTAKDHLSFAVEFSYGYGKDVNGTFREIPESDPYYGRGGDTGFTFLRWRGEKTAEAIKALRRERPEGKLNILCLGAGLMPEIRHFLTEEDLKDIKITCCDSDPEIDIAEYFDFDIAPYIEYRKVDVETMLGMEMQAGNKYDMIYVSGLMSYVAEKMPQLVAGLVGLLSEDGKLLFDLQLGHWVLKRDVMIFDWGGKMLNFHFAESPEEALGTVKAIVEGAKLPVEVAMETSSKEEPVGVAFTLTRNA